MVSAERSVPRLEASPDAESGLAEARHILVTGATRGIGYATALRLLVAGHWVTITSRVASRAEAAAGRLRGASGSDRVACRQVDLGSFADIREGAAALVRGRPVDVVMHNAGVILASPERSVTADGLEDCLQCHAVGPMLLMACLGPALTRPGRMIAVSSGLHAPKRRGAEVAFDFDDPNLERNYHPERAYRHAKLAQLWFVLEWERRFGALGLHGDAVCPGFVPDTAAAQARGFQRFALAHILPLMPFATTLDRASRIEAEWCLAAPDAPGGRYFGSGRVTAPSADARNPEKSARFWQLAEAWIGQAIAP